MTNLERARAQFSEDRFARQVAGVEILEVGDHYAKCRMALDGRHQNANGHVMGGAIFTLADFTFAVATNFDVIAPTVTSTAQICYMNSPKGRELFGESRLLRDGRHNCFYEVYLWDELDTPVAMVTMCGVHLPAAQEK